MAETETEGGEVGRAKTHADTENKQKHMLSHTRSRRQTGRKPTERGKLRPMYRHSCCIETDFAV